MMQHAPKTLWHLTMTALLIAGCTGSPMPIPPSLESERIAVQEAEPGDPCPEGDCIYMIGDAEATEANAVLLAHRVRPVEFMVPEMPSLALTHVDEMGRFEVLLHGPAEGILRVLIHGEEGTLARNLEILPGEPGTPRAVAELAEEWPDTCLVPDTTEIDFGSVTDGETATAVVQVENTCDEMVFLHDHFVLADPEPESEWTFGVLARAPVLEPHAVMSVVVAFWPSDVAEYRGALFIFGEGDLPGEPFLMSIPVRGVSTPRE